jgi:hypothetical protein
MLRRDRMIDALAVLQNGLSKSERMKTHSLPVVVGGGHHPPKADIRSAR